MPDVISSIKDITYKPGYSFKIELDKCKEGLIFVYLVRNTVDSAPPHDEVKIKATGIYIRLDEYPQDVVRRLYEECLRVEMHEASEWFKFKGIAPYHPHLDDQMRNRIQT